MIKNALKKDESGGIMMSTYMAKAGQIDRKWYVIDAAGKPLGPDKLYKCFRIVKTQK